jgi:hypothetical protein
MIWNVQSADSVFGVSFPRLPLRFILTDFEKYGNEVMIGKDSLNTIITNALIEYLTTG